MMMNSYEYNGVQYHDEQIYSVENQIKDQLAKCEAEGNSDDTKIAELNAKVTELLGQVDTLTKEKNKANDDLETARAEVTRLTEEAKVKDARIAELEAASKSQQPQQ